MLYRHQFIWLTTCNGVIGWKLDEINAKIDEFNKSKLYQYSDFFSWLSYETGVHYSGFSYWNDLKPVNPLFTKLHIIKKMEVKNNA